MGAVKIKRLLIIGIVFVIITFYLFSTQFNAKKVGLVKGSFMQVNLNIITNTISNWLGERVLGISYEKRFCKHVTKWNSSSKYPPVKIVAQQLNIHDGDSIFINGLHCGEWAVALKGTFPNIKLYGVDKDPDSIEYVRKLVNGTFEISEPFELHKSSFTVSFDHGIVDGIISIYSPDLQCKTVKQMIPMLKAGGSMYIGKNFEQCEEKAVESQLQTYLHIQVLSDCYWSKKCLHGRSDVVEILYSEESRMLDDEVKSETPLDHKKEELLTEISRCATSIFIYKHIVISPDKKSNLLPASKYISHKHDHKCTHSETVNSTNLNKLIDREGIKKAVMDMKIKGLDMH